MRVSRAWEGQGVDWSDSDYLRLDWGVISIRTCLSSLRRPCDQPGVSSVSNATWRTEDKRLASIGARTTGGAGEDQCFTPQWSYHPQD